MESPSAALAAADADDPKAAAAPQAAAAIIHAFAVAAEPSASSATATATVTTPAADSATKAVKPDAPLGMLVAEGNAAIEGRAAGGTTTVKVWLSHPDRSICLPELEDPDFAVPGLAEKAPVAVCISGGGFRATTLALGWLRALRHLGLLDRVRYLSTISGSSWLGAALSFQPSDKLDAFLGRYLPPEECTPEALAEVGEKCESYARAVADASPMWEYLGISAVASLVGLAQKEKLFKRLLGSLASSGKERREAARHWTSAMARAFLEPFGLGSLDESTVRVPGTRIADTIRDRAVDVGRGAAIYDANVADLPYLIIGQALFLPNADTKFYPFEWTPLYGGCPVAYSNVSPKLGAGWVETLGLNATLVNKPAHTVVAATPPPSAVANGKDGDDKPTNSINGSGGGDSCGNGSEAGVSTVSSGGSLLVEVRPMGPASLGEATGISSGYVSLMLGSKLPKMDTLFQKALGFHSAKYFDTMDWNTEDLLLTDGGGYDLYGIYPALRRRLPNIMIFNCNGNSLVRDLKAFGADKDLPGLFGRSGDAEYDRAHQVFPQAEYERLFEALQGRHAAGEAPVHVGYYEVQENQHLGIPGGWTTRVMWIINERMTKWEENLPKATRAKIPPAPSAEAALAEADATGGGQGTAEHLFAQKFEATLADFPYVDTFFMDYSPELVSMLANHAAWMLVSNEQLVRQVMGLRA